MSILSSTRLQREIIWLKIVAVFAAVVGFTGIYIGGHVDSGAIILDAMYSLICMMASIFLILFCQKIEKPANERYHFGYYKFEPAMVALQAVLIITSCLFALIFSLRDILHPSDLHQYLAFAAFFQLFLAAITGALVFLLWLASQKYDSALLKSQVVLWAIDGLESLFLGLAFLVGIWLKKTAYAWFVPYIDPVLVFVLVMMIIREPIKLFKENFADLLDASPRKKIKDQVHVLIESVILQNHLSINLKDIRLRRAGRKLFIYLVCYADDKLSAHNLLALERLIAANRIEHYDKIDVSAVIE